MGQPMQQRMPLNTRGAQGSPLRLMLLLGMVCFCCHACTLVANGCRNLASLFGLLHRSAGRADGAASPSDIATCSRWAFPLAYDA
jgi:hypothetical protein